MDSCSDSTAVDGFVPMARKQFGIPLNHAVLRSEQAAHSIWGTNLALCRPDGHVAWRANTMPESAEARKEILATVTGYQIHEDYNKREMDEDRVRAIVGIATSLFKLLYLRTTTTTTTMMMMMIKASERLSFF